MVDFPYTLTPQNLKKFFGHIQTAGVPSKVTIQYLNQSGYKSTNDRSIIQIMKFIGFIDSAGTPTERWNEYRNKGKSEQVVGGALKAAYTDLFSTYPDAHRKDNEALRDYFSAHTKVGERALKAIVDTFKTLCSISDFENLPAASVERKEPAVSKTVTLEQPKTTKDLVLNINIQLQLPATEDASIYDKLFAALKKHLISG